MATDAVKVLIVERNGVDLSEQEELNLTASTVPFTAPGFSADNVKDAILEINQGGDDIHSGQHQIDLDETIHIFAKKQMRIFQHLSSAGHIINDGWIIVE